VPPALKHASAELRIDAPSARIVVVADTHSSPHAAMPERLAELRPDAILHAGDIGDLSVLDDLARAAPLHAVRGNIDTRAHALPDVLTLDLEVGGRSLRILMTHIAVYGPKLRADVARMARAAGAPLVVCGHSHVPFIGGDRTVTVFNPGSIGPRRFSLPIVFGLIDIPPAPAGLRLQHIDVATGQPWLPPG
jgi:putative phosphoesterase